MDTKTPSGLTTEQKIKAFAAVGTALFCVWLFFIPGCEGKKEEKKFSKMDALFQSHPFVESQLKAPSTAKFCTALDGVTQFNDTTFSVRSCVDSQNAFGAMLRSSYSCTITFVPSQGKAEIGDLKIE